MVEQWSPKPRAEGSSPSAPASFCAFVQNNSRSIYFVIFVLLITFCVHNFFQIFADIAQQAEHILGKDEVSGSNPLISSTSKPA